MKVVVTGGSGQLGTLVLSRLAENRKIKAIVAVDLAPPLLRSKKIEAVRLDVRHPEMARYLAGVDALVHLAFVVSRPASPELMRDVNVEGSRRVFTAALEQGVRTIVYSSSIAAYGFGGPKPVPVVESTPRAATPGFPYAQHKFEVERILDDLEQQHSSARIVRLRAALLVGRDMTGSLGALFRRRIMPSLGGAPVPVVWDEDVADAVSASLLGQARGAFNLVAEGALSAAELAREGGFRLLPVPSAVVNAVGAAAPALRRIGVQAPERPWLDAARTGFAVSVARARDELGWKPRAETAGDVMRRYAREVPRRLEPSIAVLLRLTDWAARHAPADPAERRFDATIYLRLTGANGGDVAFRISEGRLTIASGIPRPADSVVTLTADDFMRMLVGKLDYSTAQIAARIKVQGEPLGAWAAGSVVTAFERARAYPGPQGMLAQTLAAFFERELGRSRREQS